MSYKVAAATSDGININLHFGQAESFAIYEVYEDFTYRQTELRIIGSIKTAVDIRQGYSGGCGGRGHGDARIAAIEDCRAVLCAKCGAGTERELGKRNISSFVLEKPIKEVLEKIIKYYAGIIARNV